MKKSIQEEIEALRAETAAANAATAAYNREKEIYRRQADETAVGLSQQCVDPDFKPVIPSIDYSNMQNLLCQYRKSSIDFIKNALS